MTPEILQRAVDAVATHGTVSSAARALGIPDPSFRHQFGAAQAQGYKSGVEPPKQEEGKPFLTEHDKLRDEIRMLRASLNAQKRQAITFDAVKKHILELWDAPVEPPTWLSPTKAHKGTTGVPTLFCSDWHWGEVVKPHEIDGVNEYNIEIAQKRVRKLWERAQHLLFETIKDPKYDGIVIPLGGDMVTGDIHEELAKTNDAPIMPTVLDLIETIVWLLTQAAEKFGRVYVPCVTGNHGRSTYKIQYKERGPTSFDWLAYHCIERALRHDKRITFQIPDGPDILYKVYNHSYLLTHGDQFRGGDGMIGALGPIMRGSHKKQSRNATLNRGFSTMIVGHWHQLIQLQKLVVNGALKGYDEYAYGNNFSYERASQALWVTHPKRGITLQMPVYVDEEAPAQAAPWISLSPKTR